MTSTIEEMAEEIKKTYREKGEEISDEEASEAAWNLQEYAKLVYDISVRYAKMDRRLRKEPKGFPMEHGASCVVCHNSFEAGKGWYDGHKQKCLSCQKAFEEGVIPGYVCENRDSFYSMYDLNSKFKLKTQRVKKLIKENWFKAQIIVNESGREHFHVFLKSENPQLAQAERFNPIWKSCKRNEKKVSAIRARKWVEEMRSEFRKRTRAKHAA